MVVKRIEGATTFDSQCETIAVNQRRGMSRAQIVLQRPTLVQGCEAMKAEFEIGVPIFKYGISITFIERRGYV